MKNEALFRGIRVDNGEWVSGYLTELFSVKERMFCIDTAKRFDSDGFSIDVFWVVTDTVTQFTGFIAHEDIKVFGGDILKFTDEEFESFYAEVFWKEYAWMLRFIGTGEEDWLFEYIDPDYYEIEKVGDIYQNTELLNHRF